MSDVQDVEYKEVGQEATPEQQARMQQIIEEARQLAQDEAQKNLQLEVQLRGNSLSAAVHAHEGTPLDALEITKTAVTFLKFLKQGEATNV